MSKDLSHTAVVQIEDAGHRLDQICVQMFPQFSRARIQSWIKSGDLKVNNKPAKPKQKVAAGETVFLQAILEEHNEWVAEPIDLNIIYEDEAILVVNKAPGLVVHPAVGNWSGTLLNGLIHYNSCFKSVPRAGIVHRLDKDTSGLMVVAKSIEAQANLVQQLQARSVSRHYQAVVQGELTHKNGTIDAAIGRHPTHRTKMSVLPHGGKEAITHYKVMAYLNGFTHVNAQLETGRTHQIRVHMAHLGYPLVGDGVYGKRNIPKKIKEMNDGWPSACDFKRQALHAWRLALIHPYTNKPLSWDVPLAEDIGTLIHQLS